MLGHRNVTYGTLILNKHQAGIATALLSMMALAVPSHAEPIKSACSFANAGLPADTIVVAAGAYSGRRLAFQIDQSGSSATQFDIAVHSDHPVALLLGAYEPTIWAISWSKGTRIVAVFATGYHTQAVAGLPKDTPVINSSYEQKSPCGFHYIGGDTALDWVNPTAREVFGRAAVRVYNRPQDGAIDIVESTRPKSAYFSSDDTPAASFRDMSAPLSGTAGLEAAVAGGALRPLTAADIEHVREHYRRLATKPGQARPDVPPLAHATMAAPPVWIPPLSEQRGYVVLKPFVFPAGLYGAHSANFLVLQGVPAPTGKPGHSLVVNLNNTVPCEGAMCRR